jgi:hypothetical protein
MDGAHSIFFRHQADVDRTGCSDRSIPACGQGGSGGAARNGVGESPELSVDIFRRRDRQRVLVRQFNDNRVINFLADAGKGVPACLFSNRRGVDLARPRRLAQQHVGGESKNRYANRASEHDFHQGKRGTSMASSTAPVAGQE